MPDLIGHDHCRCICRSDSAGRTLDYNFGGVLQEPALKRAFAALEEFSHIIHSLKCQKTMCIATSALRDAPNASVFIAKVKNELNIHIKIIEKTMCIDLIYAHGATPICTRCSNR